jgi:methionyl-tRNA formyltransferase
MITKEKLRIVFMGTPEFAVHILQQLIQAQYNVVGVITAPDRPAGRGQKLHQSAVKTYALSNDLTVLQPTNLKSDTFVEELTHLQAHLQVVVAFRMLPKVVWQLPQLGTFNLHASLLPDYRGAAPINWTIINGENETGVTTFFIDDQIDTGAILKQKKIPIASHETALSLHDKLMIEGGQLVLQTIEGILQRTITPILQTKVHNLQTAYKLNKTNCKIDWNSDMASIDRLVRGLNPYPGAWCVLQNGNTNYNIKIYEIAQIKTTHSHEIGQVIAEKSSLKVAVKSGYIELVKFKFPGKRLMDAVSFLNGFTFEAIAKMN